VDDLGWGGRGRSSTGRPQTKTNLRYGSPYWNPTPPVHGRPDCNIFCVLDVLHAIRSGRRWTGGKGVFQTNDIFCEDVFDGGPLSVCTLVSFMFHKMMPDSSANAIHIVNAVSKSILDPNVLHKDFIVNIK